MMQKSFVLTFLVTYAFIRAYETFSKRAVIPGEILIPCSLPLIVAAYVSLYLIVLWNCYEASASDFTSMNISVGVAAVLMSVLGRNWAIRKLGIYHSIHIEIREEHQLIEAGPYSYVRNPYYLSNVLEAIGLVVMIGVPMIVLAPAVIYLVFLGQRLILEERALESKFNEIFFAYKRRVPRLIPRISPFRDPIAEKPLITENASDQGVK
jgi:protein-S-isoprenylcysteine O-methyltransferase Ste14